MCLAKITNTAINRDFLHISSWNFCHHLHSSLNLSSYNNHTSSFVGVSMAPRVAGHACRQGYNSVSFSAAKITHALHTCYVFFCMWSSTQILNLLIIVATAILCQITQMNIYKSVKNVMNRMGNGPHDYRCADTSSTHLLIRNIRLFEFHIQQRSVLLVKELKECRLSNLPLYNCSQFKQCFL